MHDLPPFGLDAVFSGARFHPGWTAVGLLLLVGYLAAFARARTNRVGAARVACFVAGVLVLLATLSSGIDTYAMSVFWVHMIEHLLLIMVVPMLLVLGHPLTVSREALSDRGRDRFDRFVRTGPVALITSPLIGLAAYAAVIIGTHLTGFMDAMAVHGWLMPVEQAMYVVAGWLLLLTLIGDEPVRWRLPYLSRVLLLLVAMVPDTVVGIVLLQSNHVLFPTFMSQRPGWSPDAVADQQIAGGLMWAAGDGLMMAVAVAVVIFMISDSQHGQVIGPWLESVRRQTLADHVGGPSRARNGSEEHGEDAFGSDADVDEDEDVLDAYNRMLARLSDQERRTS